MNSGPNSLSVLPEALQSLYLDALQQLRQSWAAWIQRSESQQQALTLAQQLLSHLALIPDLRAQATALAQEASPTELAIGLDELRRELLQRQTDTLAPLQHELLLLLPKLWQTPEQHSSQGQDMLVQVQSLARSLQQPALQQAAAQAEQAPWQLLEALDQVLATLSPRQRGLIVSAAESLSEQVQQACQQMHWQTISSWAPEQIEGLPALIICDGQSSASLQEAIKSHFPDAQLLLVLILADVSPDYSWSPRVDQVLTPQTLGPCLRECLPRLLSQQRQWYGLEQDLNGLTSVSAGRHVFTQMQALSLRHQTPFSIVVLQWLNWQKHAQQTDSFLFNEWLRKAVFALENSLRTVDVVLNWAPDKLVLLLPQTALKGALIAVERCHQVVQKQSRLLPSLSQQAYLFQAGLLSSEQANTYEEALSKAWHLIQQTENPKQHLFFDVSALPVTQTPHVLLLDDDPIIQQLLKFTYAHEGYQTTQLFQGDKKVLDILTQEVISLIILDVKMPGMDGFEVLELIRSQPQFDHIPIVMLTSIKQEVDISRAFTLGANDYLYKPFSPAELLIRTQRFLE